MLPYEKIYQEATGNYKHKSWSGISEGCGYLWDEIKDRVAAGDFMPYVEPAEGMYDYNESTNKYHRPDCRFANELTLKTLDELAELNAIACGVCCPPEYDGYGQ